MVIDYKYLMTYLSGLPLPPWNHLISAFLLSLFVCGIAYTRHPWFKAMLASVPVPLTFAYLISGIPVGSMHLFGYLLSIAYHWLVYLMVHKSRVPLLVAIVL